MFSNFCTVGPKLFLVSFGQLSSLFLRFFWNHLKIFNWFRILQSFFFLFFLYSRATQLIENFLFEISCLLSYQSFTYVPHSFQFFFYFSIRVGGNNTHEFGKFVGWFFQFEVILCWGDILSEFLYFFEDLSLR